VVGPHPPPTTASDWRAGEKGTLVGVLTLR
jgi:hypothetical protein